MESAHLLVTPVLALIAALLGAGLAARLHQSVVMGYLLAGVAIGPFTPGPVGDSTAVLAIAEIGVILLLFAIGVELSLRDLLTSGRAATVGAPLQIALSMGTVWVVGGLLGLPEIERLFFGAALAISSSALLTKMLGESGQASTTPGRVALAWSAVQDLSLVLLMVLLTSVAGAERTRPADVLLALGKAVLFLGVIAPAASVAFPWLLDRVAALRNREVFLFTIAVVALGTAYVSSLLGLSLALGAFVAGVVVGESDLSQQVLGEVGPLRDIFAGLFFVSIGMLLDPWFAVSHWPLVLLTLGLILVPKAVSIAGVLALARLPARVIAPAVVLLAHSGEFSFLLAQLGRGLGVVSPATFNAILLGGAVSMLVAPILLRATGTVVRWLERRDPAIELGPDVDEAVASRHAILCGYGRVGRVIAEALMQRSFRFVVVEEDPHRARDLRARGIQTITGNAANARVLELARPDTAHLLIVAVDDPVAARAIVAYARQVNQRLDIVVRVHSEEEVAYMRQQDVAEAVMGEHELALEMTRHALHRYGLSALESLAIIRGLRERLAEQAE
jgi:CPA2 family monovalent cation:H+ antiporter-2